MWTQIIGKIRLAQTPLINHWWNVPLYVAARGLTTSVMPYANRSFQIDFDFIDHQLIIALDDGETASLPLRPCSVADFYAEVMRLHLAANRPGFHRVSLTLSGQSQRYKLLLGEL